MVKRFIDGLAFGAGLGIALVAVWIVASWVMSQLFGPPVISEPAIPNAGKQEQRSNAPSDESSLAIRDKSFNLSPEEQISEASVIAIVKYEPGEDGRMKAIVSEIPKREPDVEFNLDLGDEYYSWSYYPEPNVHRGDAALVFFVGSPATMKFAMPIYDDRIPVLGDMPLDLFRKKCTESAR